MKREIAMKWADLLESGDLKKVTGVLEMEAKRCCALGALCNMALVEGVVEYDSSNKSYGRTRERHVLPPEVQEWAGMKTKRGEVTCKRGGHTNSIPDLNDGNWVDPTGKKHEKGLSFKEIAAIIRQNYKEL